MGAFIIGSKENECVIIICSKFQQWWVGGSWGKAVNTATICYYNNALEFNDIVPHLTKVSFCFNIVYVHHLFHLLSVVPSAQKTLNFFLLD